jgi:hypothetical protein
MKNQDTKKIFIFTLLIIFIIILYFILDYSNIFNAFFANINVEMFGIILNSLIIFLIFIITYFLVDEKNRSIEEKRKIAEEQILKNKIDSLNLLLKYTYNNCNENIKLLSDETFLIKNIIPKINFDSITNPVEENLKKFPFIYESEIIDLFMQGVLDKQIFENYLVIKDLYNEFILFKIVFFDINEDKIKTDKVKKRIIVENIKNNYNKLTLTLGLELTRIKSSD